MTLNVQNVFLPRKHSPDDATSTHLITSYISELLQNNY